MGISEDFAEIQSYAHFWNWLPDWGVVEEIYRAFPESYSVLIPFAYTYMEELIRATTSEYGQVPLNDSGEPIKRRKTGTKLVDLAIDKNIDNIGYVDLLKEIRPYYEKSCLTDTGDNRNSVLHGYVHPRFWSKASFEQLIHHIALLSKYAEF